ncbi:MAG TPA: hypothetical protein VFS57_10630, partial [Gemmatimonadaceae bacterium]|nr:hypothetical protein [Gemmatimonadaceae bacterium]
MTDATFAATAPVQLLSFADRRRTADRIFRGALIVNSLLTGFWLLTIFSGGTRFFQHYLIDRGTVGRLAGGIGIFYVAWGFIWYAIKNALLKWFVG